MQKNEQLDKRIRAWQERPYSWSQHSSFDYSYEQWFQKYILGNQQEETPHLVFGKTFAKAVEDGTHTAPVLRYKEVEHEIKVKHPDGFRMVGVFDSWDPKEKRLCELKTGVKPWDQKRVDNHGQLTFYAALLYLSEGQRPEDIHMTLQWLPTRIHEDLTYHFKDRNSPEIRSFETKRTMVDVLTLLSEIRTSRKNMEKFALQRLAQLSPVETELTAVS